MISVTHVGWKAFAALRRTDGVASVAAPLTESMYLFAGDTLVWAGKQGSALHPRAILTVDPLPRGVPELAFDVAGLSPWRAPVTTAAVGRAALRRSTHALVRAIRARPQLEPSEFALLLVGKRPRAPLAAGVAAILDLAAACDRDDARAAAAASFGLVGFGRGLTPSGDDFLGGVFFARARLGAMGVIDHTAWTKAGATLARRLNNSTHPISAVLLSDMIRGHGHAPLHELACALVRPAPRMDHLLGSVRTLARIGSSSGWNMLAGFITGVLGRRALP